MSTIPEIIYSVRESVKQYTDDSELDDRYILFKLNMARSVVLRQELNNLQRSVDVSVTQSICLKFEEVSAYECGLDIGCETIMRSVQPIPKVIDLDIKPAIYNVKPTKILGFPFTFVTRQKAAYYKHSPFPKTVYAFLHTDNHIYLISKNETHKLIDCVTVEGVFFDPSELRNYTNCCDCSPETKSCFNEEITQYPLAPHHLRVIIEDVFQSLAGKELRILEDKTNNANDTTTQADNS